ncbi:hypothetical protein AX16_007490 [Volvariella volvacea WC 439]|nr:hypothetical protein AX16_007490 [Volvariella volvacea WC 439]
MKSFDLPTKSTDLPAQAGDSKAYDDAVQRLKEEIICYKTIIEAPAGPPPSYDAKTPNSPPPPASKGGSNEPDFEPEDEAARRRASRDRIVAAMRAVAQSDPDTNRGRRMADEANELEKSDENKGLEILKNIGIGIGVIIAIPFAVTGAVLYGVGSILKGIGGLLTFGQ